jgi:hypothetical protein
MSETSAASESRSTMAGQRITIRKVCNAFLRAGDAVLEKHPKFSEFLQICAAISAFVILIGTGCAICYGVGRLVQLTEFATSTGGGDATIIGVFSIATSIITLSLLHACYKIVRTFIVSLFHEFGKPQ